jgi:hypothetical protein
MHPLLEEIQKSEVFRLYKITHPQNAKIFYNRIVKDLPSQWRDMEIYKAAHTDGQFSNAFSIGGGRMSGVMPEVYACWCAFSRPKDIDAKTWLRQFIQKHPELWLTKNEYTGKVDKNI